MSEKNLPALKLSPGAQAIVEKLQGEVTHDKQGDDSYLRALPAELSAAAVKLNREYDSDFVAATGYLFGQATNDAMKGDKNLQSTSQSFDMLHGTTVTHKVDRHRHFPDIRNPEGPGIDKFGVLSSKVTSAAGHNAGDYKKVRDHLQELAMTALGGKK